MMIKFVYFDAGGVVIKDFSGTSKWDELTREIGITSTNKPKFDEIWKAHIDVICTTCDADDLMTLLRKELDLNLPHDYSFLMGFVSRFEKNEEIWPVISEIKKEVPIGLLTNMYPRMLSKIEEAGLNPKIDWDVIIDSSVERLQKPDEAIYRLAEERAKVSGDNILFVDNTQGHLDAAKKLGWQTLLFDPKNNEKSCGELMEYFIINK